ncbi:unannotated protein [freshwater metagenome]|uniref:Unannotated protein n=1 Tax=freshwater metagenome TaxID=449393 RepID=A0A6J7KIG5_9ZZZZ
MLVEFVPLSATYFAGSTPNALMPCRTAAVAGAVERRRSDPPKPPSGFARRPKAS